MVCANILRVEYLPLKTAIMCFRYGRKDHSGNWLSMIGCDG